MASILASAYQKLHRSLSDESYTYRNLYTGQIRLLEILPSNDAAEIISCRLHIASIDRCPRYEALSYCWGSDTWRYKPRPRISIEEQTLPVMPNLEAFLRQYRQDGPMSLLWIDAVCINQEDHDERRQQIELMCKLYMGCHKLIVWLGIEDDDSKKAIAMLKQTYRLKRAGPGVLRSWQNTTAGKYYLTGENHHLPLHKFFSRSWFSRAWIIQEFVLGSTGHIKFQCGNQQLSKNELEAILDLNASDWAVTNPSRDPRNIPLSNDSNDIGLWYMNITRLIMNQAHLSRVAKGLQSTSLLFWLTTIRYADATDPRDKVYAALGLAEAYKQNVHSRVFSKDCLILDYSRPVGEVYASLVQAIVTATQRVDVLLGCCNRSRVTQSWAPDWSVRTTQSPGFQSLFCGSSDRLLHKKGFRADRDSKAVVSFSTDLTMRVRGFVWATVECIPPRVGHYDDAGKMLDFIKPYWISLLGSRMYSSERVLLMRLWQTLLITADAEADELLADNDFVALGLDTMVPVFPGRIDDGGATLSTPALLGAARDIGRGRLFVTAGRRGVGKDFSGCLREGDVIVVLLGCHVPVALRRVIKEASTSNSEQKWEFVRSAYIDGIMFGEAIDALHRSEVVLEDFVLV